MIDIEKVKKGLECCSNTGKGRCEKSECPYWTDSICCIDEMQSDALELLKEQEAVEPIPYHRSDGTIFKYECRKCRTKIFKMDLFCRHCGRSVKWE